MKNLIGLLVLATLSFNVFAGECGQPQTSVADGSRSAAVNDAPVAAGTPTVQAK